MRKSANDQFCGGVHCDSDFFAQVKNSIKYSSPKKTTHTISYIYIEKNEQIKCGIKVDKKKPALQCYQYCSRRI